MCSENRVSDLQISALRWKPRLKGPPGTWERSLAADLGFGDPFTAPCTWSRTPQLKRRRGTSKQAHAANRHNVIVIAFGTLCQAHGQTSAGAHPSQHCLPSSTRRRRRRTSTFRQRRPDKEEWIERTGAERKRKQLTAPDYKPPKVNDAGCRQRLKVPNRFARASL